MGVSPFSSWRNVRRGRALGGERKAKKEQKGEAENRSMQFIKMWSRKDRKEEGINENFMYAKEAKQVAPAAELNIAMKRYSFQPEC